MLAAMLIEYGKPRKEQEETGWEVKAVIQVRGDGAQGQAGGRSEGDGKWLHPGHILKVRPRIC